MNHGSAHQYLALVAGIAGWFAAGGLLGVVHFLSLRWNVRSLVGGQPLFSLGLQLLRFALTGGALMLVIKSFGGPPLVAAAFGLMTARTGVLLLEQQ